MARKTKMLLDYNQDEGSDDGKNDEELHTRLIVMMLTMIIRKMINMLEMRKITTLAHMKKMTRLFQMRKMTPLFQMRKMTTLLQMRKMTTLLQVTEREAAAVAEWESSSTGLHSMRFKRKSERNGFTEFFSLSFSYLENPIKIFRDNPYHTVGVPIVGG